MADDTFITVRMHRTAFRLFERAGRQHFRASSVYEEPSRAALFDYVADVVREATGLHDTDIADTDDPTRIVDVIAREQKTARSTPDAPFMDKEVRSQRAADPAPPARDPRDDGWRDVPPPEPEPERPARAKRGSK